MYLAHSNHNKIKNEIIIYVCAKDCMDPQMYSKNISKHHLAGRKEISCLQTKINLF